MLCCTVLSILSFFFYGSTDTEIILIIVVIVIDLKLYFVLGKPAFNVANAKRV